MKIIEVPTTKQLYVVSGRSHLPLAVEIADCLGVELGEPNLSEFANGEIKPRSRSRSVMVNCSEIIASPAEGQARSWPQSRFATGSNVVIAAR